MKVRLNRQMALEQLDHVPDGAGGFTSIWMPLGTLWADVKLRSGGDAAGAAAAMSVVTCKIVVRGAPAGSSMRPKAGQRLREGPRVFVIDAVAEMDAGAQYLVCFAKQEQVT